MRTNRKKIYRGNRPEATHRNLQELLPAVLEKLESQHLERPDLLLSGWNGVVGPQIASMTEAESYSNGFLTIRVKDPSLYSLLHQYERPRLLALMRRRFPKAQIKAICFRAG